MQTATIHQAKTHLSRLLRDVQRGETVVILNNSVPVAKLTGVEPLETVRPSVGTVTSGPIKYTDDAFQPLTGEELEEWGL
jgi:prevent-host-death family protein